MLTAKLPLGPVSISYNNATKKLTFGFGISLSSGGTRRSTPRPEVSTNLEQKKLD